MEHGPYSHPIHGLSAYATEPLFTPSHAIYSSNEYSNPLPPKPKNVASCIARSFDARGEQQQWPPMTEIMRFKNHNYLLNFLLFVSSLKYVPYRRSMFLPFYCPLDRAAWGGHTTRTALSQAGKAIKHRQNPPLQL
jgi:hypothetical protein